MEIFNGDFKLCKSEYLRLNKKFGISNQHFVVSSLKIWGFGEMFGVSEEKPWGLDWKSGVSNENLRFNTKSLGLQWDDHTGPWLPILSPPPLPSLY